MARKVNTTFQGATQQQCDPGALQYTTVIENAVGDTALAHDRLTGENSPASVIDHTGDGEGCPLGVPLGAQAVRLDATRPANTHEGAFATIYLFAHPILLPRGETGFTVEVPFNDAVDVDFEVRDTNWDLDGETTAGAVSNGLFRGTAGSLTPGERYFALVKMDIGPSEIFRKWVGYRCYFPRIHGGGLLVPANSNLGGITFPIASEADGSDEVMALTDWDESMFADDRAIHAQLPVGLNRNQQALAEYLTAAPAGGNDSRTLTQFHDHTQGYYTNEGVIDLPVCTNPLGAITTAPSAPDYGTFGYGAPAPQSTAKSIIAEDIVVLPTFPEGVDTSRLRVMVLVASPDGLHFDGDTIIYALTRTGAGLLTERSAALTQMGTTSFGYVDLGANSGTGNRIPFVGGEANVLRLSVEDLKVGATRAIRIVGYHWYFDGG